MESKEHTGKLNGYKWTPLLIAIVGAVLGSSGGIALVFNTPLGQSIARPDPFTGANAAALSHRISDAEIHVAAHIANHPDKVDHYDRRITTLEVQFTQILDNQKRIISKLDAR